MTLAPSRGIPSDHGDNAGPSRMRSCMSWLSLGPIDQAWAVERPLLLALLAEPFDACETVVPRVCVTPNSRASSSSPSPKAHRSSKPGAYGQV